MDIFEESFKAFSEMKTSKQVNISHKGLTENVDVNKLKKPLKGNTIAEKVQSRDLYSSIYNYLAKRNSANINEETIKDLTNELVDWYNNFMEEKDASNINDIIKNYIRYSGYDFYIKPLTAIVESKIKTNKITNESLSNYDASLELVNNYGIWDLDNALWSGAQDRWKDYTDEQKKYLMDYFALSAYDSEEYPSLTLFNDFIWFDSDDILAESDLVDESCKSYHKKRLSSKRSKK